jgi:hypothetical protein
VNSAIRGEQRTVWVLWAAAAVVAVGGLMPFVFGGTSSRIDVVIVPFWIGAAALAACAVFRSQGRAPIAILYFVAGLAIVYGLLSIFSLPVRLAVLGTCPATPAPCPTGLPRPLTDGENTGLGVAAAFGLVAIFLGFYGLVNLYRRPVVAPEPPRVRTIPPIAAPKPAATPEAKAPEPKREPQPEPELPAHEEEELPELPPHESSTPTT